PRLDREPKVMASARSPKVKDRYDHVIAREDGPYEADGQTSETIQVPVRHCLDHGITTHGDAAHAVEDDSRHPHAPGGLGVKVDGHEVSGYLSIPERLVRVGMEGDRGDLFPAVAAKHLVV